MSRSMDLCRWLWNNVQQTPTYNSPLGSYHSIVTSIVHGTGGRAVEHCAPNDFGSEVELNLDPIRGVLLYVLLRLLLLLVAPYLAVGETTTRRGSTVIVNSELSYGRSVGWIPSPHQDCGEINN